MQLCSLADISCPHCCGTQQQQLMQLCRVTQPAVSRGQHMMVDPGGGPAAEASCLNYVLELHTIPIGAMNQLPPASVRTTLKEMKQAACLPHGVCCQEGVSHLVSAQAVQKWLPCHKHRQPPPAGCIPVAGPVRRRLHLAPLLSHGYPHIHQRLCNRAPCSSSSSSSCSSLTVSRLLICAK